MKEKPFDFLNVFLKISFKFGCKFSQNANFHTCMQYLNKCVISYFLWISRPLKTKDRKYNKYCNIGINKFNEPAIMYLFQICTLMPLKISSTINFYYSQHLTLFNDYSKFISTSYFGIFLNNFFYYKLAKRFFSRIIFQRHAKLQKNM